MNTHLIILVLHIIFGFTALTVGIVPMIVKKGGALHRASGKIYAWAMYGISATTLGLFLLHPEKAFLQFLLCIAFLGFYFTFTGVRSIRLNRTTKVSRVGDKWVAWLTLIISLLMSIFGSVSLIKGVMNNGPVFLGILYLIFGLALASAARADLQSLYPKKEPKKMQWFLNHLIRMLSAYIATFTAFCVVNVHFLPPLVVWTMPGLIGGTAITLLVNKYRKKFERAEAQNPLQPILEQE